ncbi:MAG: hypothetical protein KTQ49_00100 [Candidatus Omnitrophica bacterium]|nr:hypothetical protein [Candidatus Omnitrophota bacterium]
MKKRITPVWKRIFVFGSFLAFAHLPAGHANWEKPVQPPGPGGLTCVLPHPHEPSKILASSSHQLFENDPKTGRWQTLWSAGSTQAPVRRIFSFDYLPDHLFILTERNIFMGELKKDRWQKVHADRADGMGDLLSFTVDPQDPNRWFLGTQTGLWETRDAGKTWSRSRYFAARRPVFILTYAADRLFIGGSRTLYVLKPSDEIRQTFALPGSFETAASSSFSDLAETVFREEEAASPLPTKLFDLIVAKSDPNTLWLGTAEGVFESKDRGFSWHALPSSGLQSTNIRQLAHSEKADRLYAATPRGIYTFSPARNAWEALFKGLAQTDTESMALLRGAQESLAAITPEGLMQFRIAPEEISLSPVPAPPPEVLSLFRELVHLEPSAREVQKAVIRYADVSNGKIKRWHVASRAAGLLPTFSFGRDYSTGNNIDLDRGGTNDPDRFIYGPNDTDKGWDARVSWDLGDILYSSDQTSIDSREKMMVELRNDLLSEVTRVYYERRRLQIDLLFTPPASEQEHLDGLLRIDELTALLDGMTNGFFSKRLERLCRKRPDLNQLWIFRPVAGDGDSGLAPRDSKTTPIKQGE